jgi:hypothetical protein
MFEDRAYQAVIHAFNKRWRRRRNFAINLGAYLSFIAVSILGLRFPNDPYGNAHALILYLWFGIVVVHFIYNLMAGIYDRAMRREIERERKWRLLERMDVEHPVMRERALRLMDMRDGELVEFDEQGWETNVKAKRGM